MIKAIKDRKRRIAYRKKELRKKIYNFISQDIMKEIIPFIKIKHLTSITSISSTTSIYTAFKKITNKEKRDLNKGKGQKEVRISTEERIIRKKENNDFLNQSKETALKKKRFKGVWPITEELWLALCFFLGFRALQKDAGSLNSYNHKDRRNPSKGFSKKKEVYNEKKIKIYEKKKNYFLDSSLEEAPSITLLRKKEKLESHVLQYNPPLNSSFFSTILSVILKLHKRVEKKRLFFSIKKTPTIVRIRNRCLFTGNTRSLIIKARVCRHFFKKLIHEGEMAGFSKASF